MMEIISKSKFYKVGIVCDLILLLMIPFLARMSGLVILPRTISFPLVT